MLLQLSFPALRLRARCYLRVRDLARAARDAGVPGWPERAVGVRRGCGGRAEWLAWSCGSGVSKQTSDIEFSVRNRAV